MNKTVAELIARAGLPADADIKTALPGLTFHVTTPLKRGRITTIGDLAPRSDADLLEISQFGQRRLDMLKAALAAAAESTDHPVKDLGT
ncbi:DNA-directed RNA polymerase subunit alpha C-terminal domain-containing protein [Nonomuraea wenchangensis]